ncbi:molybdopterin cofactor-binding domain-containing protein [Qipengyuania sp. DSG2-2]|uniref:xanthine dehydrogenase family protein molybdopterin-binding subunit n=1 Tax=Qipengyuania sp. DGS2-2 TaxID=3349631 RepID=UPI0036D27113
MRMSRRGLLAGAAVGGGLVVAWALYPRTFPDPLATTDQETAFGAWLKIAEDGVITVAVPQLEMGQGVTTILAQIIAVELGADWRQIAVEPAPVSGIYANVPLAAEWAPLWMPEIPGVSEPEDGIVATRWAQHTRLTATAAGTTLAAYETPAREAAATARSLLVQAAADRWGVAPEQCDTRAGFVVHENEQLRFAELAREAALLDPPETPPVKVLPAAETPLPGEAEAPSAFPRLDLPSKVDGSHLFAGDIRLPGMVYAAIRHAPVSPASGVARFDRAAAEDMPGVVQVVEGRDWLAAVAENGWAAEKALDAMAVRFSAVDPVDSASIEEALDAAVREGEVYVIAERGETGGEFGKASIARRYDVAPALHTPLETATAAAWLRDGRLELWMASQAPERAREAAAKAIGLSAEKVVLYPMPAGGSFDRRLEHEHAIEAALLAREVGRPLQLTWSREQETLRAPPRAPAAALLAAKFDSAGGIAAMRTRIAVPSTSLEFGRRLFANDTHRAAIENSAGKRDPLAVAGALPFYAIPDAAVYQAPVTLPLPTGRMRGGAHGLTAFFTESFIDEIAAKAAREPLSFRIGMLGGDPRMVACLQRAARMAEWGGGRDGAGQGLACHRMGDAASGGSIACVATARQAEGGLRVTRLTAAVDIGRIVNLDIARQQIEGGLVHGLALAMGSSAVWDAGRPDNRRLSQLGLPRLPEMPEVEVDLIASEAPAFDPGELGLTVAAPAIANALFSATGLRLRRLPLLSGGL